MILEKQVRLINLWPGISFYAFCALFFFPVHLLGKEPFFGAKIFASFFTEHQINTLLLPILIYSSAISTAYQNTLLCVYFLLDFFFSFKTVIRFFNQYS